VVLPNDPSGDIMQLVLPATSAFGDEDNGRWPFRAYVKMLANHNISAGRVVTKMQFDTKATAPRVLFSPVAGVPADIIDVLATQAKKPAAENAVKLTVYQQDEGDAPAAPAAPEASVAEPVVTSKAKKPAQAADVADVLKEWTKK
jgi:UDP-N-acetylmuramyl pentapeptide synthase